MEIKAGRRPPAVESLRRHVLCTLTERGPLRLEEIPRAWPVLRLHVQRVLQELMAEGLVERRRVGDRRPPFAVTSRGKRALACGAGLARAGKVA